MKALQELLGAADTVAAAACGSGRLFIVGSLGRAYASELSRRR